MDTLKEALIIALVIVTLDYGPEARDIILSIDTSLLG